MHPERVSKSSPSSIGCNLLSLLLLAATAPVGAQGLSDSCEPAWIPAFGPRPGVIGAVSALLAVDDGSGTGEALYVGGDFLQAGNLPVNRIARWDGNAWSALGSGLDGQVYALIEFDDGGGPALIAAGSFMTAGEVLARGIAKWDGESWSSLGEGLNGTARALAVFDDGSGAGPALFVGGEFTSAGGRIAHRIAKWDGASWSAVGTGLSNTVRALVVFDDGLGGGPALYAGGVFTLAGTESADRIAKWNGSSWSPLSSGLNNSVFALAVFDAGDGEGPALYAGGVFSLAGGTSAGSIAKWNGVSWSALGTGVNAAVYALAVYEQFAGSEPRLAVGGSFSSAGGISVITSASWDGKDWSALGTGWSAHVHALAAYRQGSASLLVAGTDTWAAHEWIRKWDGSAWTPIGSGINQAVRAVKSFDDGSGHGPSMHIAGSFRSVGGVNAQRIARWDGSSWFELGGGMDGSVSALEAFEETPGAGPALFAAGSFDLAGGVEAKRIARWDGASWSALGTGLSYTAHTLAVFDAGDGEGPGLYAGGAFVMAGGVSAKYIARWDGKQWTPLGTGVNRPVTSLMVFDDHSGSGPALYVGGYFTAAGPVAAKRIARWDGKSWTAVGGGFDNDVLALEVFDDGTGGAPALYATGRFTMAGQTAASRIARWDGQSWSALGTGLEGSANALGSVLRAFDDGTGSALYCGGWFSSAGGAGSPGFARWDGVSWSPMGKGLSGGQVSCLEVIDDGHLGGPVLCLGGAFVDSPRNDSFLAFYRGCPIDPECRSGDLDCDGAVDASDLGMLLGQWGACAGCTADMDGDGVVDGNDLGTLLGLWSPA